MIPLYRTDPYLQSAETIIDRVIETPDGRAVFCREALFLEGGGQPMDHGTISNGEHSYPLLKIIKEKGNTGYVISSTAVITKGMTVRCELDFDRRYRTMRLHTGQHALAGSLRIVRNSILTGGMKISEAADSCTVLYPVASALTENELESALIILKQLISEDKAVRAVTVASETEAIQSYGELYRPTVASGSLKGSIRLVLIDGADANACGGTHVKSLKEVVGIHITDLKDSELGREITFTL